MYKEPKTENLLHFDPQIEKTYKRNGRERKHAMTQNPNIDGGQAL